MTEWKVFKLEPYVVPIEINQIEREWIIVDVFKHKMRVSYHNGRPILDSDYETMIYIIAKKHIELQGASHE